MSCETADFIKKAKIIGAHKVTGSRDLGYSCMLEIASSITRPCYVIWEVTVGLSDSVYMDDLIYRKQMFNLCNKLSAVVTCFSQRNVYI